MATKSRTKKPIRSQEELIFDFDEDSDPRNPKSGEFVNMPGKKSVAMPSSRSFKGKKGAAAASLPVNIPDWSRILQLGKGNGADGYDEYEAGRKGWSEEDEDSEGSGVPPHVYLAKRRGASSSVHEGVGRTLKGRDLRRVRNAIWEKVGFED